MAKQTPQQFVKAALAAEREQWTGPSAQQTHRPSWLDGGAEAVAMAAEDGLLPAEPHTTLLDPQDRQPMAACAIAVVCVVVMAIAEVIPW